MNNLINTIWIELRKAIRSRIPFVIALGFLMMPLACGFLIFIYKNPDLSQKLGLVSAKANLVVGSADWPSYLKLILEATAMGGFFFFCMMISWVFGREFTDGTLKDLLAVPVSRSTILLAKFIVVAIWSVIVVVIVFLASIFMGAVINLPQGSTEIILQGSIHLAITACLAILVVLPFAFFASLGRGFLLPLGIAILTTVFANLAIVTGYAEFFPWAILGLYSQGSSLNPASYWIVVLTGLAGMYATYLWWRFADQSR